MAYNINGITVRNLPEQVDYLTDLLNAIAKTMGVDISMNPSNGTLSITKTSLTITGDLTVGGEINLTSIDLSGTLDVEGAVSLGNSAEVDGTLTLNSPNDLQFKTGKYIYFVSNNSATGSPLSLLLISNNSSLESFEDLLYSLGDDGVIYGVGRGAGQAAAGLAMTKAYEGTWGAGIVTVIGPGTDLYYQISDIEKITLERL